MRARHPSPPGSLAIAISPLALLLAFVPNLRAAAPAGDETTGERCCTVRVSSEMSLPVQRVPSDFIASQINDLPTLSRSLSSITTLQPGVGYDVTPDAAGVRYGDRMALALRGVGVDPALLIGSEGGVRQFCGAAAATPALACGPIEVFTAGSGAVYGADATSGVIRLMTRVPTRAPGRFTLGAGLSLTSFTKLEEVACGGLSDCVADGSTTGFGAFVELALLRKFRVGAAYGRTSYQVTQRSSGTAVLHDVAVHSYDFYGQFRPMTTGRIQPYGMLGMSLMCNESEILAGGQVVDSRGQSGFRVLGGAGIDWSLIDHLGVRTGASFASGGSVDADTHGSLTVAVTYEF